MMKNLVGKINGARQWVSLALAVTGMISFAGHNVADAIFAFVLAIWIEQTGRMD